MFKEKQKRDKHSYNNIAPALHLNHILNVADFSAVSANYVSASKIRFVYCVTLRPRYTMTKLSIILGTLFENKPLPEGRLPVLTVYFSFITEEEERP